MIEAIELWCDGGLMGRNPSRLGGTWCYCHVKTGERIGYQAGLILPRKHVEADSVTNNVAELVAALRALASVPEDWDGVINTDSRITLLRITKGMAPHTPGVPEDLRQEFLQLHRTRRWRAVLVAGHPNKKELARGYRLRNGLPASKHNVFCDEECQRLARVFLTTNCSKV